jgi:hypothetical protein
MTRIVSGHQPSYLPWLGLLHKASLCDDFVFMDDVQFLRRDWNHRNRVKGPDGEVLLTVPVTLPNGSRTTLKDTRVAETKEGGSQDWQSSHWKSLSLFLGKAPYWDEHAPFLERFYMERRWRWLAELCLEQLTYFLAAFGLKPRVLVGSEQGFSGYKSDLVLEHAQRTKADTCVTGRQGVNYIDTDAFSRAGVALYFQDYAHPTYPQRFGPFLPMMCALDLLCNTGPDARVILSRGNVNRADLDRVRATQGATVLTTIASLDEKSIP